MTVAELAQSKGHILAARKCVELGRTALSQEQWCRSELNPFCRVRMKLAFQSGAWTQALFDPKRNTAHAEMRPNRHSLGLLWRTAWCLFLRAEDRQSNRCFDAHWEISSSLMRTRLGHQEAGNGVYVRAHMHLLRGDRMRALSNLEEAAHWFSLDVHDPASAYFSDFTKFAHVLCSLSVGFHLAGETNKARFALGLACAILRQEEVIVPRAGGLEAFCCVTRCQWSQALDFLSRPAARFASQCLVPEYHAIHAQRLLSGEDRPRLLDDDFYREIIRAPDYFYSMSRTYSLPRGSDHRPIRGATPMDVVCEDILTSIRRYGRTLLEVCPATARCHNEEGLRDLFLAHLKANLRGTTSEEYRRQGRTDILVDLDGSRAFVAEFKLWRGSRTSLMAAIDQLLGYLTWRDPMGSLILVNKQVARFSQILAVLPREVSSHGLFVRQDKYMEDGEWRFRFKSPADDEKAVTLHVFAFNMYWKHSAPRCARGISSRRPCKPSHAS